MSRKSAAALALLALCLALPAICSAAGFNQSWFVWQDPSDAFVTRLGKDKDLMTTRRDTSKDPKREAGLVNPQRYAFGLLQAGFPTYLGAPMAFTTDDLKAGKVDVALVGMVVDDNGGECWGSTCMTGARFAANAMRTLRDWMNFPTQGTDNYIGVDYASQLTLADYGNVGVYYNAPERSLEEIHKVLSEVLDAGAVPIGVGGTHIQSYAFITALAQKYGPQNVTLLHIDAHHDAYLADLGRLMHNGNLLRVAVEQGLVRGRDLIQVGLRSHVPDAKTMAWMRQNGIRSHFMAEVLGRILDELKGRKVYITFDMDGLDPSTAPAVGTQDPDGLTATQALQLMRAVGIQNEVVAADFMEYFPLLDDGHQTTGIMLDRLIRALLAGIAARKQGITDPLYLNPERIDHGTA
ncbi:hypothetical protein COHA_005611 [Chlorella ohadii]|uniref:Agmatinase n=1 Tax=Chlorella ohadii TaxID=2649997 RepID=A0AAD5DUK7_9CHLO|nr:hypothetical protein COHA_005611 [Chlorella ohadii]